MTDVERAALDRIWDAVLAPTVDVREVSDALQTAHLLGAGSAEAVTDGLIQRLEDLAGSDDAGRGARRAVMVRRRLSGVARMVRAVESGRISFNSPVGVDHDPKGLSAPDLQLIKTRDLPRSLRNEPPTGRSTPPH